MAIFYESLMPVPVYQLAGSLAEGVKRGWKHELTAYVGVMQAPSAIVAPGPSGPPPPIPVYVMIFSISQDDSSIDAPEPLSKILIREFEKQQKR